MDIYNFLYNLKMKFNIIGAIQASWKKYKYKHPHIHVLTVLINVLHVLTLFCHLYYT
jgi:hypothetical protein